MTPSRKVAAPLIILVVCALAWFGAQAWNERASTSGAAPPEPRAPLPQEPVDIAQRLMLRMEPGLVIDSAAGPPQDWSHLVLHAVPRLAEGNVDKVSKTVNRLVSLLHLTIVANVRPVDGAQPPRYWLDRVAIGLALPIGDKETIVSSAAQKTLGANLGFVDRNALAENEASLNGVRQVARTSTMLVFDAPSVMRIDQKNRSVTQRHAILVSPSTGRLATLVWVVEPGEAGALRLVDPTAQILPENCEDDRMIYVDSGQFNFGIPNKQAFALVRLPKGVATPIGEDWRNLAVSRFKESADAVRLEQALRAVLGWNKEVTAR